MRHSRAGRNPGVPPKTPPRKWNRPALAILTRYDDVGLRGLPHAHPDDILYLDVSTSAVLSDMDYPEDYRRELESLDDNA